MEALELLQPAAQWLRKPGTGHFVLFYSTDHELITALLEYLKSGFSKGEPGLVIATKKHMAMLSGRLEESHVQQGVVTLIDAEQLLDRVRETGGTIFSELQRLAAPVLSEATRSGKQLRIYGEVVAILWKYGHTDEVLQLEQSWNTLIVSSPFSLFCAYPKMHFDMDIHAQQRHAIVTQHTHSLVS